MVRLSLQRASLSQGTEKEETIGEFKNAICQHRFTIKKGKDLSYKQESLINMQKKCGSTDTKVRSGFK